MATDSEMAAVARRLADALSEYAYTRNTEHQKQAVALQTELCALRMREIEEQKNG